MKKALSLIIVSTIIITTLMGCGKEESNSNNSGKLAAEQPTSVAKEKEKTTPIKIEEIELVDFVLSQDEYGDEYILQTKFKNNSSVTITSLSYTYEMAGEKVYLTSSDTLLPGDVSTIEETYVADGNVENLNLLQVDIDVASDNEDIYITYNKKLDRYTVD